MTTAHNNSVMRVYIYSKSFAGTLLVMITAFTSARVTSISLRHALYCNDRIKVSAFILDTKENIKTTAMLSITL